MGIGFGDAGSLAMMTEKRTQARGRHPCSSGAPLQGNEQGGTAAGRTFQAQVMIEQVQGFAGERQNANLFALAQDLNLGVRDVDVLAVERQDFAGPQAMQ